MKKLGLAIAIGALAAMPATSMAAVVVDGSPTEPLRDGFWTNNSSGQNFLVMIELASATNITGFEIFSGAGYAEVGDSIRVKIRADVAGSPAASNLFSFTNPIAGVSPVSGYNGIVKVTSNFSAVSLAAGTYWFGMSGDNENQTWASFGSGGFLPSQRQLSGDRVGNIPGIGRLAFNVLDDTSVAGAVPEPSTWMLLLLGFGGIGWSMRSRGWQTTRARYR
ncbi:MAG: PEPxxWA-CTERM sorting domain-containing protein [Alphaproteobacteria bacterium]|nr:PEPxxWA-CTERM sorting domain-containing protein [Alphaproteobacteria bacterium]MBU0863784.1 PEPxxWA-CTERM sorting domain-containing protein [Alphaproteobacteria bacterium]MBU1825976.1 PEPxxWA-CTERM sorting domain-containing protein [Alphaproteobacteria bacterium]